MQPGVHDLLAHVASHISEDVAASGGAFDELQISPAVVSHLSCGDLFLGYSVPTMEEEGEPASSAEEAAAAESASLHADGSFSFSSDPFAGSDSSSLWCVETHPPYWTSLYGARGVLHHDGSPARLLWGLVSRLTEEHPWDSDEGGRGEAGVWRAISAPPPVQAGATVGRWFASAWDGARHWLSQKGDRGRNIAATAGVRRVVLRIDATCRPAGSGPDGNEAELRRERHVFSAMRCIQARRVAAAPKGGAPTQRWEESCRVVWSGSL